jgi:glutathione-regulated potassium-efflux system ancillary protein KefC
MDHVWFEAALWLFLALVAVLVANWLKISTALSEIVVGTVAQLVIGAMVGVSVLGAKTEWITFLAGTGAIVLTFLAGAELDPGIFRAKWKESTAIGLVGFLTPFFGAAIAARYLLGWGWRPAWLAGVALSTCFVNDLGTVIALGLIFSPFTVKTVVFLAVSVVFFLALPFVTPSFFERYGGRVSELETKYLLLLLFGLGGLAVWSGSEAVLPAYLIGMVLAGTVGKDHFLIRRLRTLTFGLLTPFYFIRAGSFVSVPALVAAPLIFVVLFCAKMAAKLAGLLPTVRKFGYSGHGGVYYSLMMSTGLTFGTISSLFGLNHRIITQTQYSHLVATVVGSAVIPTAIANAWFMPRHLLPERQRELRESSFGEPVGELDT